MGARGLILKRDTGSLPEAATRVYLKRLELELTQREFARLVGVNQSTISEWERGFSSPSAARLAQIAELRP